MRTPGSPVSLVLLVCAIGAFLAHSGCGTGTSTKLFTGVFCANDCGVSHGGFEWAGEYTARLDLSGEKGTLELKLAIGLGDPLEKHVYSVRNFAETADELAFTIEGRTARLVVVDRDLIWDGRFDGYFTGIESAEPAEKIGRLPIEIFEGFRPHYYIELRMKPEKPSSRRWLSF